MYREPYFSTASAPHVPNARVTANAPIGPSITQAAARTKVRRSCGIRQTGHKAVSAGVLRDVLSYAMIIVAGFRNGVEGRIEDCRLARHSSADAYE